MSEIKPPVAARKPVVNEHHGIKWTDEYGWLRDPGYPEVTDEEILDYLKAENAYFEHVMGPHQNLIDELHAELKGRIKDDDSSVPVPDGDFIYHWEFKPGEQYRTWLRQPRDGGETSVLIDENALAEGKNYFNLRSLDTSPDANLLAYSTDEDGSERYAIHLKDLRNGDVKTNIATNTSGSFVWCEDGKTLLYVELNENLRPFRVRAHNIHEPQAEDPIIYLEEDPAFFVSAGKSLSRRFIAIQTGTHVTSEIWLLDANNPFSQARLVSPRRDGHRYAIDDSGAELYILTNDRHENFRLVKTPVDQLAEEHWQEVIAASDRDYLMGHACFADYLVIAERVEGQSAIRIRGYDGQEHHVDFGEDVYAAGVGDNREFWPEQLRLGFSSLTTPSTFYDYDVSKRQLTTRKVQEIPSGYDASQYVGKRVWAVSADGERIPISLVHRKDFPIDGSGRLFLYGYGSYGMGMPPTFSANRLSLLDRGFAFAIAHVRGGDELGYRWYREGKLAKKTNTFNDFICAAEQLIEEGYGQAGEIAIRGGSAGGMLMGAVTNLRPDLWRCVVAEVPFVDVVNTIMDESLPLTPIEWPEWGNPIESKEVLQRLLSYSPYDCIEEKDYPKMLVTAGISDPRVTYWEPAKYVARMRERRTDSHLLLLKTNMDAGHFGASGRYDSLKELSEVFAFTFKCYGMLAEQ